MDEILLPPEIENKIKPQMSRAIEKFGMADAFFKDTIASCKKAIRNQGKSMDAAKPPIIVYLKFNKHFAIM